MRGISWLAENQLISQEANTVWRIRYKERLNRLYKDTDLVMYRLDSSGLGVQEGCSITETQNEFQKEISEKVDPLQSRGIIGKTKFGRSPPNRSIDVCFVQRSLSIAAHILNRKYACSYSHYKNIHFSVAFSM